MKKFFCNARMIVNLFKCVSIYKCFKGFTNFERNPSIDVGIMTDDVHSPGVLTDKSCNILQGAVELETSPISN